MSKFASFCKPRTWLSALLMAVFVVGCGGGGGGSGGTTGSTTVLPGAAGTTGASASDPTVGSSSPRNGATNVPTSESAGVGTRLSATFTQAMDPTTINSPLLTFTLRETVSGTNVPGTVTMNAANTIATFSPTAAALLPNTNYTATVTTAAKSAGGTAMASPVAWTFTTNVVASTGQAPVNLGTAGDFVIFANTGIANATACGGPCITGDMGVGPGVTSTAITGFNLILPPASPFSTSAQVIGNIYAFDYAAPTPTKVTTASNDMALAYTDAAGRPAGVGPNLNIGAGTVTTQTLAPGIYTWGSNVNLGAGQTLTLSGSATDVWIFQISGTLTTDANARVLLSGGAVPKNVFWQVAGASVNIGAAPARFEGVVLAQVAITLGNGAIANSRLLAQAAVNLDATTVTQPPL
jgi:hypothetical protein